MTTLNYLDRKACKLVRDALENTLGDLGLGVHCDVGRMTYEHDGSKITCKLTVVPVNDDGVAQTPERTDFVTYASGYGLNPDDLDREFKDYDGSKCVIVGLKPRSRKYPILVAKNGKTYKYPANRVVAALAQ
jgi:hypothetical protein